MSSEASAFGSDSEHPPAPERAAMERALDLARRGWGRVAPNPMVGAVILTGDSAVAEGYHAEYGGPHAEVVALEAAGERARGATLVLNLEPCAHHGKTPPCTDAILPAVGGPSALHDNPRARGAGPAPRGGPPVRGVFDRRAMLNLGVPLVSTAREVPTWVMSSLDAPPSSVTQLERSGVRVFRPTTLRDGLRMLREAGIQSLLCEGGGALGARLLTDGLVDRLYWVQAPVWLGEGAVPAFPGVPPHPLAAAPRWTPGERRGSGPRSIFVFGKAGFFTGTLGPGGGAAPSVRRTENGKERPPG